MRQLVRDQLIEPLGLSRTEFPPITDTALAEPHTNGYLTSSVTAEPNGGGGTLKAGEDVTDWSSSIGGAAGMMNSTIDDLAAWAATGFGSDLLPAQLAAERNQTIPMSKGDIWGYGLGIAKDGYWYGHLGGIPGWTSVAVRNSRTGTIVIAAANAYELVDELAALPLAFS